MLTRKTGAWSKVLNCYGLTDLIQAKDPLSRKWHIYTCAKTLYTIIGKNSGSPKDEGSETLSPLWLSGAYVRAPHIGWCFIRVLNK